jgi:carbon-monoxide dehydrogenase medium subunit
MVATLTRNALEAIAAGEERQAVPVKPVLLWGRTDGRFSHGAPDRAAALHTTSGEETIDLVVNGQPRSIGGANGKTLLRMLRENAGLTGTKEGCAEGECGACTVFMDGIAVMSCMTPAPQAHGREIKTVEGLANGRQLHPVQQAFVDRGAVQCGYCTPGFIMSGVSLLEEREKPSGDELRQAITGNLCRCTGYYKIMAALEQAAQTS